MRVLFLILLIALVTGAWWLARRGDAGDDLTVAVVFPQPSGLRSGDPVVVGDETVGSVREVVAEGSAERVHVAIEGAKRGDARSDSVWRVDQRAGAATLVIDNRVAVGPSLEDGAEVRGGVDATREWLARGREWFGRVSREAETLWKQTDGGAVERQFDEWSARVPEWKQRGGEAFAAAREEVARGARAAEQKLRESGRTEDADRLRARLDRWLAENPPPPDAEQPQ